MNGVQHFQSEQPFCHYKPFCVNLFQVIFRKSAIKVLDDPQDAVVAKEYMTDKKKFEETAK